MEAATAAAAQAVADSEVAEMEVGLAEVATAAGPLVGAAAGAACKRRRSAAPPRSTNPSQSGSFAALPEGIARTMVREAAAAATAAGVSEAAQAAAATEADFVVVDMVASLEARGTAGAMAVAPVFPAQEVAPEAMAVEAAMSVAREAEVAEGGLWAAQVDLDLVSRGTVGLVAATAALAALAVPPEAAAALAAMAVPTGLA